MDVAGPDAVTVPARPGRSRGLRTALVAVLALAALVLAGGVGYLWGSSGGSTTVTATSVDAGFARDMSTHHRQAITMASYTRDHTADPDIKLLALDIETEQYFQIGQMQGWLDGWGLTNDGSQPEMAWMGMSSMVSDGLMPGMASPAQMSRLQTLTGTALDVDFLQLMLRHHQGGLPMARYAATHASSPYVRDLAAKMVTTQSNEVVAMEQLLRQRGATPLPAPPSY